MSSCSPEVSSGNVGLAFGLVTAAGLSTAIGAALAFVLPYSTGGKNLYLAASLGVAAGVMVYVSFVEIFTAKAIPALEACVERSEVAYLYGTLCFFGGIAITWAFDQGLHVLQARVGRRKAKRESGLSGDTDGPPITLDAVEDVVTAAAAAAVEGSPDAADAAERADRTGVADETMTDPAESGTTSSSAPQREPVAIDHEVGHDGEMVATVYQANQHDPARLARMGMFAAFALAAHNFPEGLATFVAVLEDPKVGASVAIAIGIHNIPEGICVAMPIYYATGSRWKAFWWAVVSGLTELVGAVLGYIVLREVFSEVAYGVLFGIVAGMMVYISVKELLPTAHRYDPDDQVTTMSLLAGMLVMAASLVLFQF